MSQRLCHEFRSTHSMHICCLICWRWWQCDGVKCGCCCRQVGALCIAIECGKESMLKLGSRLQVYRMILDQRLVAVSGATVCWNGRCWCKWKVNRGCCWCIAIWGSTCSIQWQGGWPAETQHAAWYGDKILWLLLSRQCCCR